eukprot:Clim_evm38s134 gene=Clim_evmTU38s134
MAAVRAVPVFERYYYSCMHSVDTEGKPEEDLYLRYHNNGLVILGIDRSHWLYQQKNSIEIKTVDFGNRLNQQAKGKSKKGSVLLAKNTVVGRVFLKDGREIQIRAGLKAQLLEVNERLIKEPELLLQYPEEEGYLAVLSLRKGQRPENAPGLLNEQAYLDHLNSRKGRAGGAGDGLVSTAIEHDEGRNHDSDPNKMEQEI